MTTVPGLPALHINSEWEAWATAVHDTILGNADLDTSSLAALASSVAASYVAQTDSIAALKALTTTTGLASVRGYYLPGDGGGGLFRWDPTDTATADDGGITITSAVTALANAGRWKRVYDGWVNIRWFGANPTQTDNTRAIQAAISYVSTHVQSGSSNTGGTVFVPSGTYKCTFTAGTSGLSTLTINSSDVLIAGEGTASQIKVSGQPAGTRVNYIFTFSKTSSRGAGGGIRDLNVDGASMTEWVVFLDCWRVWELDFVSVTNVYSGILDACNNQSIAAGQEGENIVVRHWNLQNSSGGAVSRYAIRFRPGVTSGSALNAFSDVVVSQGLAKSLWDTGVVFDNVSRSHIYDITAANSGANYTNTGDGVTRSGVLHAVAILNSSNLDAGRHIVENIYLESHVGTESPTTNSVVYVDSTSTGQNYGSRFRGLRTTLASGSSIPGFIQLKNTSSTTNLTRDHVVDASPYSWPGLAQIQVGVGVLRTVVQAFGGITAADVVDAGTSTKVLDMNALATAGDVATAVGSSPIFVRKTSDQTVTASVTLISDTALSAAVAANGVYIVEGDIFYDSSTVGDIKFNFTGPTGAVINLSAIGLSTGGTGGTGSGLWSASSATFPTQPVSRSLGGAGVGTLMTARVRALVVVSSTSGTLQLQWAQDTSDATVTTVRAGSFIRLTKVG